LNLARAFDIQGLRKEADEQRLLAAGGGATLTGAAGAPAASAR
jgi:hypothetical protein